MRRISGAMAALTIALLTVGDAATAAEATFWRAGVAKVKITPQGPYFAAGYGGEKRIATERHHDLWIKVLALEDARGQRGLLITSDICGFDRVSYDAICTGLKQRCGLDRAQIILNSTHNHSGPVTRNSLMPFHDFTPDDLHRIGVYTRDIEQKAINAAAEAFGCLAPATLSLGAGQADFAVNRRNNPDSDIPKSLPHRARLRGPVDHRVPVIAVRSPAGGLLAVVFAYSCHPVMTAESVWSGDFPGFAMLDLEQAHPKAMALFCQGCGGDQNCVRGPIALAREQGRLLATTVEEALAKPMTGIEPRLATTEVNIMLDYERVVTRQELEAVLQAEDPRTSAKARWARQVLAELKDRGRLPTNYSYPMQAWKLGTKTLWVALSGEPLVDYALTLQKQFGPDTLVTGYCSDLMAYVPTRRIWEEARGEEVMYLWEYGRPAYRWAGDVEPRILAAVEQMARTLEDQTRGRESSAQLPRACWGEEKRELAGFRGEVSDVQWTAAPDVSRAAPTRPDMDLVAMGRWGQHFLVHNANPELGYACRFSLDWSCPPKELGVDLVANGDTDCRSDWELMFLTEMCGPGKTAEAAQGVRRRILGYLSPDHLAHVPGAIYCGGVPGDRIYISPWTTGKILVSLAETYARTGERAAKERARQVFVALRGLASWDAGRAWFPGGSGPYLDGKWYETFVSVNYGCQTEPVFRYWELTGDAEALQFAEALARGTVAGLQANLGCRRVRADGSFSDHTHIHIHEVWGGAHVGAVRRDTRLTEWARRVYEYVRSRGADYGWFPERMILDSDKPWDGYHDRVHISETCVTGDMVSIAAWLAQGGHPQYWDHVERYVRNYIRDAQFMVTPDVEAYWREQWKGNPPEAVEAALARIRRYQGACGAMIAVNGGPGKMMTCGCCAPEGMRAMYTAWKNTVLEDSAGVWVNMSFDRDSLSAKVVSFLPEAGRLDVVAKKSGDFHLRPPSWAPRGEVGTFRNGKTAPTVWKGDYVLLARAAAGERLTIAYPLPTFRQKLGVGGKFEEQRVYKVRWRGNTCLDVEPRAESFPFFSAGPRVLPPTP